MFKVDHETKNIIFDDTRFMQGDIKNLLSSTTQQSFIWNFDWMMARSSIRNGESYKQALNKSSKCDVVYKLYKQGYRILLGGV